MSQVILQEWVLLILTKSKLKVAVMIQAFLADRFPRSEIKDIQIPDNPEKDGCQRAIIYFEEPSPSLWEDLDLDPTQDEIRWRGERYHLRQISDVVYTLEPITPAVV